MQQTILATRYMLKTIKTGYTIKIMIIYRCQRNSNITNG